MKIQSAVPHLFNPYRQRGGENDIISPAGMGPRQKKRMQLMFTKKLGADRNGCYHTVQNLYLSISYLKTRRLKYTKL
jgi:hypothetical protein